MLSVFRTGAGLDVGWRRLTAGLNVPRYLEDRMLDTDQQMASIADRGCKWLRHRRCTTSVRQLELSGYGKFGLAATINCIGR